MEKVYLHFIYFSVKMVLSKLLISLEENVNLPPLLYEI